MTSLRLLSCCALLLVATAAGQIRAPSYPVGINCGGVRYTDSSVDPATVYIADQLYGTGDLGVGYAAGQTTELGGSFAVAIGGTLHGALYSESRDSAIVGSAGTPVEYRFLAPAAGDYLVTLHTRDGWGHNDFWNPYIVELEGLPITPAIAPHQPNRRYYASRRSYRVRVTDGGLDVRLVPRIMPPYLEKVQVCAIRVDLLPAQSAPSAPTGLRASTTYCGAVVRWRSHADYRVHGYEIERSINGNASLVGGVVHADRLIDDLSRRGLEDGDEVVYRVRAIDVWGTRSAWTTPVYTCYTSAETSTVRYYEINYVSTADLLFQDFVASWMFNDASTERPALFRIAPDGQPHRVSVRYRGRSNMVTSKKSRKVKFDSGHPFGTSTKWRLNLNGEFWDPTFLHSHSSFAIWDLLQQPGPTVEPINYALVVNDPQPAVLHQGLHISVENLDDQFIKRIAASWNGRHPMTKEGHLYKAEGLSQLTKLPSPAIYQTAYTLEVGSAKNKHRDLIELIETIDDASLSGDDKMHYLARNMDLDNVATWLAINALIGNADHTWHNYFLYRYPGNAPQAKRGMWQVIPWDMDSTWINDSLFVTLPLKFGSFGDPFTPGLAQNRLVTIMASDESSPTQPLLQLYHDTLDGLRRDPVWTEALGRAQSFHSRIDREARLDPWKQGWDDDTGFANGVAVLTRFHGSRSAFIAANIGALRPAVDQTDVRINEFMVANNAYLRDPDTTAVEFDPWIEIRNYGPIPRDLSDWSLSDNLSDPGRWPLPAGTVIEPFGHLLVWADGQPGQGAWHTKFRLDNANGGAIHLFRAGKLVDSRPYAAAQPDDTSLGRHPDQGNWLTTAMQWPTPRHQNWPGSQLPTLHLNEIVSDNAKNLLDDHDQADDWIEVYNPESVSVSLDGLFLTNNASKPTLWRFPNMVIPARSFVLVWADSQPEQARYYDRRLAGGTQTYHAGFSISKSGATLQLTAEMFGDRARVLQSLAVPALPTDQSWGRDPNGRYVVYATPTPGLPNP